METNEKLKDLNEVIAFLAEKFPACFTTGKEAKPLKIGIFKDIAERLDGEECVSKTQLRQALRRYTSSWKYLRCVEKGGSRVDLDGNLCEELLKEHMDHASEALKESRAKFFEKKKATQGKDAQDKGKQASKDRKPGSRPRKSTSGETKSGRPMSKDKRTSRATPPKRSNKPKADAKPIELKPVTEEHIKKGVNVKVRLGKAPVDGVVTDISRGEIHVQLRGGIVIKTSRDNLFIA